MKTPILFLATVFSAHAAVLSGTGPHLPIAGPHNPSPSGVGHSTIASGGGWLGTWSAPAPAPWIGTFSATGPTTGSGMVGTTTYDFSTLPTGTLPAGTLFLLGDVDSGADTLDFRAWDSTGNLLDLWLNDTIETYANGTGPLGVPVVGNMPGWTWDGVAKSYNIDGGTTFGPNPNLGIVLESNQPIHTLEVVKPSFSYGFGLRAPDAVPEPSSALLATLAGSLFLLRRRRCA